MMTVAHMKLYLSHLTCRMCCTVVCIGEGNEDKYLVQTRSQARSSGMTLPKVHGLDKAFDPNV